MQAYDEKRRAKEAAREATEQAQQREIERAEAERQKALEEEASKWIGLISVEHEGTGEADVQEESQVRLSVLGVPAHPLPVPPFNLFRSADLLPALPCFSNASLSISCLHMAKWARCLAQN
jgi:hypothetical protein